MLKEGLKKVCVVIASKDLRLFRELAMNSPTYWVELRLDYLLSNYSIHEVIEGVGDIVRVLRSLGKGVIITLREVSEGGLFNGELSTKEYLLTELVRRAKPTYVDIELSLGRFTELVRKFNELGVGTLASIHYLSEVPKIDELVSNALKAFRYGAKLFKAVFPAKVVEDNLTALKLCSLFKGRSISFCLGSLGRLSRVLAPLFGAPFTYAYVGKSVASGQLSLNELLSTWSYLEVISP